MPRSLDPDAQAILTRLKREGITALYHFTSVENLPSICQMGGLYSKQMLEDAGKWPCPFPGGEGPSHRLDRSIGNWDKVSLSPTPHTPMAYKKKGKIHFCFFIVRPEVATWLGVVFTDTNAAGTTNQLRDEGLAGLNNIQFDLIRSKTRPWDQRWKQYVQAEVLMPGSIPFTYVSEVAFVSNASKNYGQYLCESFSHPKFVVNAQIFTDSPDAQPTAITFAYVREFLLTGPGLQQNMVYLEKNKYSKVDDEYVTVVALVNVLTGIQGKIILCDMSSGLEDVIVIREFPRRNKGKHTSRIPLKDIPLGVYSIKYYLGNLCWSLSSFEVVP